MRYRTHTNPYNYYAKMTPLALDQIFFAPNQPLDLEIGYGRGRFLRYWAQKYPTRNIIGIEIRKNIAELLQVRLGELKLNQNTHLVHGNAERLLEDSLKPSSLENIFIFHPDPWFKKKHHKRRIVRKDVIKLFAYALKPESMLHISTDVETLWCAMKADLIGSERFEIIDNHEFWESDYTSHWDAYRIKSKRKRFCGSFKNIKPD
jgi:tRNA (guanine-N7-)-methyltransferase